MLVAHLFRRIIRHGSLRVLDANGKTHDFGEQRPPEVIVRIHDSRTDRRLLLHPRLALGEAYMEGGLTIEQGTLYDLMDLLGRNRDVIEGDAWPRTLSRIEYALRPLQQFNPVKLARRHVAHHYDLSDALYELFLDKDRQYSCAYFERESDSLEEAQLKKKRHIAAKLLLEPGCRVLDIGCGWGGLALYLARISDCEVTGITLSERQHAYATERAKAEGLSNKVRFHLRDYREETGTYDRIVSVGMFEHVGARYYPDFFGTVKRLLTEDGVALIHSIGRMEPPGATNAWLRKYIFPGGYTPALSEALAAIERSDLWVTDMEILRLHYANTIREWRKRFEANRQRIAELYDERFCRMWEFYLVAVETSFRYWRQMVFQMQIAKRQEAAPLTRDYQMLWEREHAIAAAAD